MVQKNENFKAKMKNFSEIFAEIVRNYSQRLTDDTDMRNNIAPIADIIRFLGQIDREVCYYIFNLKTMKHEYLSQTSIFFLQPEDLTFQSYYESIHPNDQMMYAAILNEGLSLNTKLSIEERQSTVMEYSLRLKTRDERYAYINESLRVLTVDSNGECCVVIGTIRLSHQNKFKPPLFYNFKTKTYTPIFENDNKYTKLFGIKEDFNERELNTIRFLIHNPELSQAKIAEMYGLHPNSIKNYIRSIKQKLGVSSLEEIINMSFVLGIGYQKPDPSVFEKRKE